MSIWSGVPFGASRTDAGARQTGAMQNHHIPTPDTGRRVRAPETWDAARAAYLDGESARDVCARLAEQARADQRAETAARTAGHKGAVQRIRAIGHAARDAQREAVRSERELHALHQLHRALPDPAPPDPDSPDPPLSRADRRRLQKLKRKR